MTKYELKVPGQLMSSLLNDKNALRITTRYSAAAITAH